MDGALQGGTSNSIKKAAVPLSSNRDSELRPFKLGVYRPSQPIIASWRLKLCAVDAAELVTAATATAGTAATAAAAAATADGGTTAPAEAKPGVNRYGSR
jgi:hypothetical protein